MRPSHLSRLSTLTPPSAHSCIRANTSSSSPRARDPQRAARGPRPRSDPRRPETSSLVKARFRPPAGNEGSPALELSRTADRSRGTGSRLPALRESRCFGCRSPRWTGRRSDRARDWQIRGTRSDFGCGPALRTPGVLPLRRGGGLRRPAARTGASRPKHLHDQRGRRLPFGQAKQGRVLRLAICGAADLGALCPASAPRRVCRRAPDRREQKRVVRSIGRSVLVRISTASADMGFAKWIQRGLHVWDTRSVVEISWAVGGVDLVLRVGCGAERSEWHGLCDRRDRLRLSASSCRACARSSRRWMVTPRGGKR